MSRYLINRGSYLAKEEMENITEDRWNAEVWGAATAPGTNVQDTANSNLIFYWGQRVGPDLLKSSSTCRLMIM